MLSLMLKLTEWNDLNKAARAVNEWANTTFPTRGPESSLFKLVMEEVPELLLMRKMGVENLEGEMADCLILLLDLCVIWGIDPATAIKNKMLINAERTWRHDVRTGFYNHLPGSEIVRDSEELDDGC